VTAVAVNAGNIGNIVLGFPAAGVTLPDGSLATTQAATDDSTKIATTAFVRNYDDTQDLDFSGTTGTGAVVLNNQTLAISGTANQVVTAAAGQTLTISLTNPIVTNLTGNVTGILKDGSSIETTVTGVTQTAGNDSTRLATTAYVDGASGAKTLDYAGDTTGPFALNLSTDDLEFNGDSNITVTAAVVNAGNKGIVTIDLDDAVTITGKMQAGTLSDGTFSGSAGTYTGGVSIESDTFTATTTPIGFIGNASTASALAAPGTIQLLSGSGATEGVASGASTYTDGGNLSITTSLANTTVTSKTLLNLPTPTSSAIDANDTINQALAKLQGQITAAGGGGALAYEGAWRASVTAVANGALSSSTALVIATADANLVKGTVVEGAGITGTVRIDAITGTAVTLDTAITIATGITLTMSPPGGAITGAVAGTAASLTTPANKLSGRFYICDTTGKAEPNADVPWTAATTPNEWAVGDWVVYISNGSQADQWQKIDQSNELFGSGAATKVALWTASNTLGTGLIADDGTTVTIGANGNLTVLGDTILGDDAAADTITLNGPATFQSTGIFKVGIGLGGTVYGSAGQVLTSGGGSGSVNTWTTPTVGTLTSVGLTETGNALTITNSPITTSGNINIAGAGNSTQYINGALDLVAFPTVDNYLNWLLAGDTGTIQTINSQDGVTFAGGFGISTVASATDTLTTAIDITGTDNAIAGLTAATAVATDTLWFNDISDSNTIRKSTLANLPFSSTLSGTQYTIPMFATTSTLGDSMITQNAGGTAAAINGRVGINTVNNTSDTSLKIDAIIGNGDIIQGSSLNSTNANEDCRISLFAKGTGSAIINAIAPSLDLQKQGVSMALVSPTGVSVTGALSTTTSAAIGTTLTTGGSITVATHGLLSIISTNNLTISGTATEHAGLSFATKAILPVTESTENNGVVDLGANGNQFKDLYLSGNVIHGGSGTGTKGGRFNKLYTTGNAGVAGVAFTIDRASSGSMVFDVMLTSDNSNSVSIAKKFTVASKLGTQAPIFNKTVDTGPDGSNDFAVAFAADGSSTTKIKCTITPAGMNAQKIGITIDLGFGQNDATVVMNT